MQQYASRCQGFLQPVHIDVIVVVSKKTRLAIVPALHNVQRNIGQMNTRMTGHANTLPAKRVNATSP